MAQAASVFVASLIAICGIEAWRKEFVGKRRIELAEEVLALFYQAKDVIGWIRFPTSFVAESATRKPESDETSTEKGINDQAYIFYKRLEQYSELFSRIHALRYRFMAQFGRNTSVPFEELKSILDDLQSDLDSWIMLSRVDTRRHDQQQLQAHQARIEKREKALWGLGKADPISLSVENVVENVDRICRPHIDRKNKIELLFAKFASKSKPNNLSK